MWLCNNSSDNKSYWIHRVDVKVSTQVTTVTHIHQSQPSSHSLRINFTVHLELWPGNHLIWCNATFRQGCNNWDRPRPRTCYLYLFTFHGHLESPVHVVHGRSSIDTRQRATEMFGNKKYFQCFQVFYCFKFYNLSIDWLGLYTASAILQLFAVITTYQKTF